MFVLLNVAPAGALISSIGGLALRSASRVNSSVITQFSEQVKIKDTSQLINGKSNVLQKLLKHFNSTLISTFFVVPSATVFHKMLALYLKDLESVTGSVCSYL